MNFLLDENVPYSIKKLLLSKGYAIDTVQELGKRGISNGDVAQIALKLAAVLITFDEDFIILNKDLAAKSRVIFIKLHPRDPRIASMLIEKHLEECLNYLKSPRIIKLTINGIREV